MKKYSLIFTAFLSLFLLTSCQLHIPKLTKENKKPIPFITQEEISPLIVEFLDSKMNEDNIILTFQAKHKHDAPINTNDYEFIWPTYVFDENDTPYKVTKFEVLPTLKESKKDEKTIFLQVTVEPRPQDEVEALMVPLYIIPSLFEHGYPVYIEDEVTEKVKIADLTIENIVVEEKSIRFIIRDNHPEKNDRKISYTFKKIIDEHPVYPIFQTVKTHEDKLYVTIQFSDKNELPLQFNIQRTTVDLPEWRFTFTLPINEEK